MSPHGWPAGGILLSGLAGPVWWPLGFGPFYMWVSGTSRRTGLGHPGTPLCSCGENVSHTIYMVAATGVLIAAVFYILNLRNAIKDRRRQTILQKLPAMNRDYYDVFYDIYNLRDWTTRKEWQEKHRNPETTSKVMYLMNIYNTVGILYQEGLMSLDDIAQLYTPNVIIPMWERYSEIFVPGNRFSSYGKPSNPLYWAPLERLYGDMKRIYPEIEGYGRTPEEVQERRKRQDVNIYSKMTQ